MIFGNQTHLRSYEDLVFDYNASEVKKGTAVAVVLAVGDNTNQGRAGLSMNIENEKTPL